MDEGRRSRRLGRLAAVALCVTGLATLAACASGRPVDRGVEAGGGAHTPPGSGGGLVFSRPPAFAHAAETNAASLRTLPVALFGRAETGWEAYMPAAAAEIGAAPVPEGVLFAQALARWQAAHGLPADGVMTAETLTRLRDGEQGRRPFLQARAQARAANGGATAPCPDPPDEATLAWTTPAESWGGRPNAARPGTLAAWRRMRAAAARDGALESPSSMQVFSAYRSPGYDAARCTEEANCDGVRRASCSAHRTGLALDLVLDGVRPVDSTAQADRLRLSRSSTYRWLLLNARRFGFVNYPFEPWHWEWTGEPVSSPYATPRPRAPPPPAALPDVQATDLLPPGLGLGPR